MARKTDRPAALALALAMIAVSGGCALLTAEHPLFSPADQPAEFVLAEGLWAGKESDCAIDPAASGPTANDCLEWFRIARAADGAWLAEELDADGQEGVLRIVFAPLLAERPSRPSVALAEAIEPDDELVYLLVVPRDLDDRDERVTRLWLRIISCQDALALGPTPGLHIERDGDRLTRCLATTPQAAIAAGRSAALSALPVIGAQEGELVFVRPAPP